MDARHFRYFVAVAEELHFSKAADRLSVAQSVLSTQIQRLEQDLGVKLLNRNKRQPVTLTDAGKLFYAEAVTALHYFDRAQQVGLLAAQGLAGIVRIGFVASAASSGLLSDLLRRFRASHPDVRIEMLPLETPRQYSALVQGEIDVGIVRPRRYHSSQLRATIVQTARLLVAMSPAHPLASRSRLWAHDLRDESFISPQFGDNEGFSEVLAQLGKQGNFAAFLDYKVHDFIAAVSLAAAGYGVAVVPESIRRFSHSDICYRTLEDFDVTVSLAVAYRQREQSPAVKAFIDIANTMASSIKAADST